jgi:hypothetical protein
VKSIREAHHKNLKTREIKGNNIKIAVLKTTTVVKYDDCNNNA